MRPLQPLCELGANARQINVRGPRMDPCHDGGKRRIKIHVTAKPVPRGLDCFRLTSLSRRRLHWHASLLIGYGTQAPIP
jgi:hypothetical protein